MSKSVGAGLVYGLQAVRPLSLLHYSAAAAAAAVVAYGAT